MKKKEREIKTHRHCSLLSCSMVLNSMHSIYTFTSSGCQEETVYSTTNSITIYYVLYYLPVFCVAKIGCAWNPYEMLFCYRDETCLCVRSSVTKPKRKIEVKKKKNTIIWRSDGNTINVQIYFDFSWPIWMWKENLKIISNAKCSSSFCRRVKWMDCGVLNDFVCARQGI